MICIFITFFLIYILMTNNQLIRQYDNFDYNSEFIPTYNIFNTNTDRFVGIGTNIPKHHLSVTNNLNIKGNIIVTGNLLYNNNSSIQYDTNYIHLLYKNKSNEVKIGRLIYSSPDSKYSDYNFYKKNDSLYINKFDDRPNTILTYKSNLYSFNNISSSINIDLIVSDIIFITHIYIYEKTNDVSDSILLTTLNDLTVNGINTTYINNSYKLEEKIKLTPYIKHNLTLANISSSNNIFIQFIGNYDFTAGNLWNNTNTTIHTSKNVSIFSNQNYNNKLYVNGSSIVNNNFTTNILKTNIFKNTANLDLNGLLNTTNITSDKLIINTNKITFGNSISQHFVTLGDSNSITNDGDLYSNDLYINSNINLENIVTNHSKISLSNNINLHDFININNINTHFYYNTIISNKSNYLSHNLDNNSLLVDGNTFIAQNLNAKYINYNKFELNDNYINSNINSLYVSGLTHTGVFTKVNDILTETFISPNINLIPSQQKSNKPGTIYYDSNTNKFKAHIKNNVITFNVSNAQEINYSNFILSQNSSVLEIKNLKNDILSTTHLDTTHLESHKTETNTFKIPVVDIHPNDYFYSDLIGTISFNTNSNEKFNIHDGTKWNTIAFEQDFTTLADNYTIIPNINFVKNNEQFIPTIPQNLKYNISQSNGNYYNSDELDNNRMSIISKNTYNLNLDDNFGIAINNNIIGIGTNFYIAQNISILDNIYQATLTEESDFEDDNYQFVHITRQDSSLTNANANDPTDLLKTYLDNQKTKSFHILNNKIFLDNQGNNNTYIKIKNKTLIANNKYSAYVYYEPILDLLQISDDNFQNVILNLNPNIYYHELNVKDDLIYIKCIINTTDTIEILSHGYNIVVNTNSPQQLTMNNNINNMEIIVKNKTLNIYNIYKIKITLI